MVHVEFQGHIFVCHGEYDIPSLLSVRRDALTIAAIIAVERMLDNHHCCAKLVKPSRQQRRVTKITPQINRSQKSLAIIFFDSRAFSNSVATENSVQFTDHSRPP